MVMFQEVGLRDLFHPFLDKGWHNVELPPLLDIRGVCDYSWSEVVSWIEDVLIHDSRTW